MARLDLFGRYKRKIWQELCDRIDADFFKHRFQSKDRIEAYYKNWIITIDKFIVDKIIFTRIRAPFVNRDDFKFKLVREYKAHRISKFLGMQDVIVGYPDFDKSYIIQGSDERKLNMLFSNPDIRQLISYQSKIHLELKHDNGWFKKKYPEGINELYFHVSGVLKDIDQLHDLYDLFAITLDHLCHIGTAYEDDPRFTHYE